MVSERILSFFEAIWEFRENEHRPLEKSNLSLRPLTLLILHFLVQRSHKYIVSNVEDLTSVRWC